MTKHTLLQGDARVGLQIVPAGSVHCCVTSPPYFNQRDYRADGQIGQEETPADYVAALVEVCRGVWQALRDDGCFYLNVGDSHARKTYDDPLYGRITEGSLIGIPWMLAFALRREGWILRMDNIWAKSKPKPSSVKNSTTPSHEYIFHLTNVPAVAAVAEGVNLVLQQGIWGRVEPLTLVEFQTLADPLGRPVKIRTAGVGEVLYDRGVFTVAGSMTVTDPERLQAYYKSGVRRGD